MTTTPATTQITTTTITPCLWFVDGLEQALDFYRSVFPGSTGEHVARTPADTLADGPQAGEVLSAEFTLAGLPFRAIQGGPALSGFCETISFAVACADQAEVDHYWESLTDGGEESMCGWLKDRHGLSWQVVPNRLGELLSDPDPARARAAMEAMLRMRRIVVADLEAAADAASA